MPRASFGVKSRTCVKGTTQATPRVSVRVSAKAWVSEPFVGAAVPWMWPLCLGHFFGSKIRLVIRVTTIFRLGLQA